MDIDHSRVLNWDACLNARELGGYTARSGKKLRWKALVRSDCSTLLTSAGEQALLDYGIRTTIDLRFADEVRQWPSRLAELPIEQMQTLNIPLDVDQDYDPAMVNDPARAISDLYMRLLETNRGYIARSLTAIAMAREGGVLFHCFAGKDRTGLVAACLLGLLGVADEDIVRDYAFASDALKAYRESVRFDPDLSVEEREYRWAMGATPPETMRQTLGYLKERYGGVEGYLRTTALRGEAVQKLRERLLEE